MLRVKPPCTSSVEYSIILLDKNNFLDTSFFLKVLDIKEDTVFSAQQVIGPLYPKEGPRKVADPGGVSNFRYPFKYS